MRLTKQYIKSRSDNELPLKLIQVIINEFPKQQIDINRIGLFGITYPMSAKHGCTIGKPINPKRALDICCKTLKEIFQIIRLRFNNLKLEEWYLLTLAIYGSSNHNELIKKINNQSIKSWIDYKSTIGEGVRFAENIWQKFINIGGKIK